MRDFTEGLNTEQREAVLHTDGPLLVVAGAGTGKTRTLTHRVAHLISSGIDPHAILAITFTNKAAQEMRERISSLLPVHDSFPTVKTFHSLGVLILREQSSFLNLRKHFSILDSSDQTALIKQAMKQHGIDPQEHSPRKVKSFISRSKNNLHTPEGARSSSKNPFVHIAATLWETYETLKKESHALDFDDLLLKTFELLKDHDSVREYYQNRWSHIHVDEYQDTNTVQYRLTRLLCQPHNNICVVGDGDQNIYSWRGADMRNILHFEKDFPGAKVVILSQNYRSTPEILEAAHEIISKNTVRVPKELTASLSTGASITLYRAWSEYDEASYIAQASKELISQGAQPSSITVLYRTNFQSRILEEEFLKKSLPYQILGVRFFERKEVKDIVSYIRFAFNPDNLSDLQRIVNTPRRGIGKTSLALIFSGASEELKGKAKESYRLFQELISSIHTYSRDHLPSEVVSYVLRSSGYQTMLLEGSAEDRERLENLKELVSFATRFDEYGIEEGMETMLEHISLMSDQDGLLNADGETEAIRLMTIHAAKGLEFDTVFIVGLEQGLFPSDIQDENRDPEEERRLMYVALTRAKKKLYLSYAGTRRIYGQQRTQIPSEFLMDIPEHLIEVDDTPSDSSGPIRTVYLDF